MKILVLALLGLVLSGCEEKPQELRQSSDEAAAVDQKEEPRRTRTMGQNEAARIYR